MSKNKTRRIGFFFAGMICLGQLLAGQAEADWAIAVQKDGRKAVAICREYESTALTELIVEDSDSTRKLGIFIGRPGNLAYDNTRDDVFFQLQSLSVPVMGISLVKTSVEALVPNRVWEVNINNGSIRQSDTIEMPSTLPDTLPGEQIPPRRPEVTAALSELGQAHNAAVIAYYSWQKWDFKLAVEQHHRAEKAFQEIQKRFATIGLVPASIAPYAHEMTQRSKLAQSACARWVCRDHLKTIGEVLQTYQTAHDGALPGDLAVLKAWVLTQNVTDQDRKVLQSLFRSPADPETNREFGYLYRSDAGVGEAILTSRFYPGRLVELIREANGFRVQDREISQAQIDSLFSLGLERLDANPSAAIAPLEILSGIAPTLAQGHNKLGFAYLKVGNLDRAIPSFDRAVDCDYKLAEAYYGLGLAYKQRPKALYDAIRYFVKALQYRRDYLAARFNLAELRLMLGEHDARADAERVIALDPTYAPAYFLLGRWFEEKGADYERAAFYYAQYMALRPDDPEGRLRLGSMYARSQNFEKVLQLLEDYARQNPNRTEVLPILSQACMKLDQMERAGVYFKKYLTSLSPDERLLYDDIRLMVSKESYATFLQTTGVDRETFLERFWAERDPNLTSVVNERQLEHYRRVWYSRQHFAGKQQPWDQRGEVYVQLGEPDYRSRSDLLNFEQSLAVQRVKERLALQIYGNRVPPHMMMQAATGVAGKLEGEMGLEASPVGATYPGPTYPVRSLRTSLSEGFAFTAEVDGPGMSDQLADLRIAGGVNSARDALGVGFRAVTSGDDASMVPWETWVYVDIGGGIEITFTDERGTGVYTFAPVPDDGRLPPGQLTALTRYSSQTVTQRATQSVPDYYVPPLNKYPFGFFYDVADFKGAQNGESALEVYTAISHNMGRYLEEIGETHLSAVQTIAALDEETGAIYRHQKEVKFQTKGDVTADAGAFVINQARLNLPPGNYRMEVEIRDAQSLRKGRYRQQLEIEHYPDSTLQISDLELAWNISETMGEPRFQKEKLNVVPLPTRTYPKNRGIFVYYEIYNLKQDAFGQTNYQVEYTILSKGNQSGIISRLARTITGKQKSEIAIEYEQVGRDLSERVYVELDLRQCHPGQHLVQVSVTDLNSRVLVTKDAEFMVNE